MTEQARVAITVIDKHYLSSSHLAWLVGNGPRFYKSIYYKPGEKEDHWTREPYQSEHGNHIVLLGHHPKLVEKAKKIKEDYDTAVRERDQAKYTAEREFQDRWLRENPYIEYPDPNKLAGKLPVVLPSASMAKLGQTTIDSFLRK